jgi:para-nitrobenzyl esterase
MKPVPLAALFATLWLAALPACAAELAVTDTGMVRGFASGSVAAYLGIPYAAPPLAALRWRPPQAPATWSGVRAARQFAPACMQTGVSMPGRTRRASARTAST